MLSLTSSASVFRQACAGCARRVRVPTSGSGPAGPGRLLATTGPRTSAAPLSTVSLAYDLHAPAKPLADKETSPIIIMHGLFGSKKNNRTISK